MFPVMITKMLLVGALSCLPLNPRAWNTEGVTCWQWAEHRWTGQECVWTGTILRDNSWACVVARLCGHGGCSPHIRRNLSLTLSFSVVGRSLDAITTSNRMDHGHKRANGRALLKRKCVMTSQSISIDRRWCVWFHVTFNTSLVSVCQGILYFSMSGDVLVSVYMKHALRLWLLGFLSTNATKTNSVALALLHCYIWLVKVQLNPLNSARSLPPSRLKNCCWELQISSTVG